MSSSSSTETARAESDAIERAKQGSAEAFELLYHLHERRIYALCLRMTDNAAVAGDLTQEAFLQVFRKIAAFHGEDGFSAWLHRIAVNVVLMHLRRTSLPEPPLEEDSAPQRQLAVARAPDDRAIFIPHDMEGHQHPEIAAAMGCSHGNTKLQLHKARIKLRDLLQ